MFNAVDLAAVIVAVAGFLAGLRRGLFAEIPRFISVVFVLLAALLMYQPAGELLIANTRLDRDPEQAQAAAFLLIVIVVWLCLIIARIVLQLAAKIVLNAKGSRLAGGLLGMARGAVVIVMIVFGANLWPNEHVRRVFGQGSFTGREIGRFSAPVIEALGRVRVTIDVPREEDE